MLKSQVSGIIDINTSVLSVRDALLQYNEAMPKHHAAGSNSAANGHSYPVRFVPCLDRDCIGFGIKALNEKLDTQTKVIEGLRADQRQQIGDVIQARYGSADESARRIQWQCQSGVVQRSEGQARMTDPGLPLI